MGVSLFRLRKSQKLKAKKDFLNLFGEPRVKKTRSFILFYKKTALVKSRLGITLKGLGPSVLRNKIRRKVREYFRVNVLNLVEEEKFDFNVVIKLPKFGGKEFFLDLEKDLKKILPPF